MKRYLTAGLLVWAPICATVWVLDAILRLSDRLVNLLPPAWQPMTQLGFNIPGLGLIIALVILFVTGALAANFLGRKVVELWEALVDRIPVVQTIYSSVKQITGTLVSQNTDSFKEVVLVEFPRPDQWVVAFVVGTPSAGLSQALDSASGSVAPRITVFVPTAPNPTSGYVVLMDKKEVHPVNITVEEALKYHLSMGVLAPAALSDLTKAQVTTPIAKENGKAASEALH